MDTAGKKFIASARSLGKTEHPVEFLQTLYGDYFDGITSIFGFVEDFSPLYGGRPHLQANAIPYRHIEKLHSKDIALDLVLSNHFFTEEAYEKTKPILEKVYDPTTSIIFVNETLAERVRADYPDFKLRSSAIIDPDNKEQITEMLGKYDFVTLEASRNDEPELLASLPDKHRVILFANSRCAYRCQNKLCYEQISNRMMGQPKTGPGCSHPGKDPIHKEYHEFDLTDPKFEGFEVFKLIDKIPGKINDALAV